MSNDTAKLPRIIEIENLYRSFGPKRVLDNVDLRVRKSELCTVVGPSGCGKSTLLRIVLGQDLADSGTVLIDGEPVRPPSCDRGIVYQKYSLFPHLTVFENVILGARLRAGLLGWWSARKEAQTKSHYYLERVGLFSHLDKYPHELSGGMQQRVAIAQALINEPKILLMDEPFGALDPSTRESMQLLLLELWESSQMTIFFVTHDLEEAVFLGTRVLVLSQYYQDGRGDAAGVNRGAKIVADYKLPRVAYSTNVKGDPHFRSLVARIREEGFEPEILRHVTEFNLSHPDSFQTLRDEERG